MENQISLAILGDASPALAPAPGSEAVALPNLPALSIRQPWAWAIIHAGKCIENRCWPTKFRGRFLIHAAKGCTVKEYEAAKQWMSFMALVDAPPLGTLQRGGIVGVAELVDCVKASASPWFMGEYGFVLRNVDPLPFTPCVGALGFFRPQNT